MEAVMVAAADAIGRHANLEAAMTEATLDSPVTSDVCLQEVRGLVDCCASALGQSPANLATQTLAKCIIKLGQNEYAGAQLLSDSCMNSALHLMEVGVGLQESLFLDPHQFTALMAQESLPLEMVWMLHTHGLMQVGSKSQLGDYLHSNLVSLSRCSHQRTKPVLQGICGALAELAFPATGSPHQLPRDILTMAVENTYSPFHYSVPCYSVCESVGECPTITADTKCKFYSHLLTSFTQSQPCKLATTAMGIQRECRLAMLPAHSLDLHSQLVQGLGGPEAVKLVEQLTDQEEVNWSFLLSFTACLVNSSAEAAEAVKDLATSLASRAVSEAHLPSLLSSLLLIRQAALEGAHIVPSYSHWFQRTFGDSVSTVVTSRKALQFVVRALTDIVPCEPAYCLKAHISHPPHRLDKCHSLVSDYITLAKTRLKDLRVSHTEQETVTAGLSDWSSATEDIRAALDYYDKKKGIPPKVLEASLLYKPYYVRRFLPTLMHPEGDQGDSREGLIRLLAKENRIPHKMMENYQRLCRESRNKSPRNSLSGTGNEDGVRTAISKLVQAVVRTEGALQVSECRHLISKISVALEEKMCEVGAGPCGEEGVKQIDLCSPGMPAWAIEVVDCIIGGVCEGVVKGAESHTWLYPLVAMLGRYRLLHPPLYLRLRELLHHQLPSLSPAHVVSVATLCSQLYTSATPLQSIVLVGGDCSLQSSSEYIDSVMGSVPHTDCSCNAIRLFYQFLQHSLMVPHPQRPLAPPTLIMMLVHLFIRSSYYRQHCDREGSEPPQVSECLESVDRLQHIDAFQQLWKRTQLTFSLWLKWELLLSPHHDYMPLCTRQAYLRHRLHSHYLPLPNDQGGLGGSVCAAFDELFAMLAQLDWQGGGLPGTTCWGEGLQVLQELSASLPGEESCLVQAVSSTTSANPELVESCVRIVLCLPPFLLFSNSLHTTPQTCSLTSLLEHCIAPHCTDHFLLSHQLTRHLFMGLVGREASICRFLDSSPLCHSSLIHHWPQLVVGTSSLPTALAGKVEPLATWIHNSTSASGQSAPTPDCSAEVLGAAIYGYLNTHTDPTMALGHIHAGLPGNHREAVFLVVFDCCVREMATCCHGRVEELQTLAKASLAMEPSVVAVFDTGGRFPHFCSTLDSARQHFCGCGRLELLPVVMFRVLQSTPDSVLCTLPSLLPLSLSAHSACLSLNAPTTGPPAYQPFTAQFIKDITTFTQKVMAWSTHQQLEASKEFCHRSLWPSFSSQLHMRLN